MSLVNIIAELRSLGHVLDEVIAPVSHSVSRWVVGRIYVTHGVLSNVAGAPLDESQLISRAVSRDNGSIRTVIVLHISEVNLVEVISERGVDRDVEEVGVLGLVKACFGHEGLLIEISVPSGIDEELELI